MTTTQMAPPTFAPEGRSKYAPNYISMSGIKGKKFDHQRPVVLMSMQERLEEYLFLQCEHGDEKDPLKGNTLGRLPHIHARIEELEQHILQRLAQ